MDMSKYVKMFVSESQEHLQKMDGLLLALEQNSGDRTALDTLFREAHSLKGMSASMGYDQLAKVSHRMEDYLDRFRGGTGVLERRGVDLLFEGVDLLRRAVEEIAADQAPTLVAESPTQDPGELRMDVLNQEDGSGDGQLQIRQQDQQGPGASGGGPDGQRQGQSPSGPTPVAHGLAPTAGHRASPPDPGSTTGWNSSSSPSTLCTTFRTRPG